MNRRICCSLALDFKLPREFGDRVASIAETEVQIELVQRSFLAAVEEGEEKDDDADGDADEVLSCTAEF